MTNHLSTINGDPITRVLATYLARHGPQARPVSMKAALAVIRAEISPLNLSDVALEQRISEAAVARGLFVVFDRRDMG